MRHVYTTSASPLFLLPHRSSTGEGAPPRRAALANGTIVAFCSASISRWIVLCVDQDDVSFISLVVYCEYPPYPLGTSSAHPSGLWCQLTKSYLALRRFTMKHAPHGEVARDPHLVRGSKLEGEDDGIEWRGSSRVSRRRCRR
jgi:hypothetical protein